MPSALSRAFNWYRCRCTPQIEFFPNIAITGLEMTIRAGDPVVASGFGINTVVNANTTVSAVANNIVILGWAMADVVFNGTNIAAGAFNIPVLMPNEFTEVRICLNTNAAINTAASTYDIGSALAMTRGAAAAAAYAADAFYYVSAADSGGQIAITGFDRDSWPTYPTNNASDAFPYVWVRLLPAERTV